MVRVARSSTADARRLAAAALAICLASPAVSSAQYFGRNKVQYRSHDFHVLATEHFDLYFHLEDPAPVEMAAKLAERWRVRLARFFDHELRGRQPIVLYSSHPDFEQTHIVDGIDSGTGGVTESLRRRVMMSFPGSLAELTHVLGHELVHAFQFDLMAMHPAMQSKAAADLPLWLVEGLAEFLTLGPVDAHTAMWLRDAALAEDLPSLKELHQPRRFPYRWGHAVTAYIAAAWGERGLADFYKAATIHGVADAVERVLGVTVDELTERWHRSILDAYLRVHWSEPVGKPLIVKRQFGGTINVGPALSPDGRWVAFLSERNLFAVDLFVADAHTGEIARQLTDLLTNPNYSALQFIDSSAAWDHTSRRLAVASVRSGRAAISLFDWPGGVHRRDVVIKEVDEITSPAWSPDGRTIAFAGLSAGVTDLFIYDLERDSLRRLTHDAFADAQPAWSPDGRRLAFVTDRFSTDVSRLTAGAYQLALIGIDGGAPQSIAAFSSGKHLNPQWSADGRSLYFVSDHDGVSNLYALEMSCGRLRRLTRAATGISGLTSSSPPISVAATADAAVAAVFSHGAFAIHRLALGDTLASEAPECAAAAATAEATDDDSAIAAVNDSTTATPSYTVSRYRPRLSIEGVSPASFAVGMDRHGAALGAGIAVAFSDMLNVHRVVTAVQINQGFGNGLNLANHALYGAYVNRARRWTWGLIGSNLPTLARVRSTVVAGTFEASSVSYIKQTERTVTFVASYATNRARRFELQAGAGRLAFDRAVFTPEGEVEWTSAASPIMFNTVSAALVGDATVAGPTSVVRGQRYRFEVAPVLGELAHVSVLADYRKYLMPMRFYTIAARALHVGRYGSGAEDPRLTPLYLGYPSLVRGYSTNSLVTSECIAALAQRCDEVDRLLGSRMAVGNVEFRFPLLRPLGVSERMYGPIPVEAALFLDGGVVWRAPRQSAAAVGPGVASSVGVTLRTNVVGLGLAHFDIARRLPGAPGGWVFQFNLGTAF